MICISGLQLLIMITKYFENIHMKHEAVAQDYQVLPLHACMSVFSANFPASGFDVSHSPGCPTLTSFQDFSFFEVGHSSLVVPIKSEKKYKSHRQAEYHYILKGRKLCQVPCPGLKTGTSHL